MAKEVKKAQSSSSELNSSQLDEVSGGRKIFSPKVTEEKWMDLMNISREHNGRKKGKK